MKLTAAYRRFAEEFFEITGRRLEAHYVDAETMSRLWGEFYSELAMVHGQEAVVEMMQADSLRWPSPALAIYGVQVRCVPSLELSS